MRTKSTGSMFLWEIPPKVRKQKCCPDQRSHQPKKSINKDDSKGKIKIISMAREERQKTQGSDKGTMALLWVFSLINKII